MIMKSILITFTALFFLNAPVLAQQIIEETIPLQGDQKALFDLKFAEDIKVENWDKQEVYIKAEVNINNNTLNETHSTEIFETDEAVRVVTGFDEALIRSSKGNHCRETEGKQSHFSGDDGYSICSHINYTIFLPADVDLELETISGNITISSRTGAVKAKSISGFVDFSSPGNQKADFYLKSITGEVYTDLDIKIANRQENPIVGYELKGKLNGGGEVISLESISGNVYVRKGR